MVRTQIQLTERQSRRLHQTAKSKGISMAEYIRRVLEQALDREALPDQDEIRQRAIAAIGAFTSGETDVARHHDRYLAEAYRS